MSEELETQDDAEVETDLPLPLVGEVLNSRYRLVAVLGSGGSSKVFEAEHIELGLRYAVKFLRSERAGAARTRQRFQQEARLLATLEHPGIASIVDIGYYRDVTPYMMLEYVAGETLRARIRSRRPTLQQTLEIMCQVCSAISAAHDKGIVHRDLKPENLMLTSDAEEVLAVRVLDFGIARTLSLDEPRLTPTGAQLGTPHYMAPEQARGEKNIGPTADVFALGVIFYELLAGSRPHPGDSHYSVIFHLLTQEPVPLGEVVPGSPKDVRAVVERCLRRDREGRYANASELGAAVLELARLHAPSRAEPTLVSTPVARTAAVLPSRRKRWLNALGSAVLGGGVVSLVHALNEPEPSLPAEVPGLAVVISSERPLAPAAAIAAAEGDAVAAAAVAAASVAAPERVDGTSPPSAKSGAVTTSPFAAKPATRSMRDTRGETDSPKQSAPQSPSSSAGMPSSAPGTPLSSVPSKVEQSDWRGINRNPYDQDP